MIMMLIRRVYTGLKKVLSPVPLAFVLSSILALAIYFAGERIGMRGVYPFQTEPARFWTALALAAIALVTGIILIARFFKWLEARRAAKEAHIPSEEELEIEAMGQVFERAVKVIKQRWSGGGRGIYALPWYLVIGDKGAGKTALIDNSDLRFPIDYEIEQELAGLRPRRAADFMRWRVAGNDAILLDIAGDAITPNREDSLSVLLWDQFLTRLSATRPRRPVNGVILVVDLVSFLMMSQQEREAYGMEVRKTINELVERLGTQMTIHLTFTKLDQVAGFADYFENLTAQDRESLFGFHFRYDSKHAGSWSDQFTQQYKEYLDRLQLQFKKRVLQLKNTSSRQEAFAFFRSFVGMEAPLKSFLDLALAPDKFTTPPLMRAVYLISNRQENAPRNVFLEAVGQRYALPAPLYGTSQAASFPYFVTGLLGKSVFPEAGLAGNNLQVERTYRRRLGLVAACSLIACGVGAVYWTTRYQTNLGHAENVLARAETLREVSQSDQLDPTGIDLLPSLDQIRQATFEFGNYREVGAVPAQLSLYQGRRIGPIADEAYRASLNGRFAPTLLSGLEQDLRDVCPKGGELELDMLRVYRMMGDLEGRDDRVIQDYFAKYWQRAFAQQGDVQDRLNEHMDYMLTQVPQAYETSPAVIRQAQRNLGGLEPYARVYSSIRTQAERQLPDPIEFRSSVGVAFDIVYTGDDGIGGANLDTGPVIASTTAEDACGVVTDYAFSTEQFAISRMFTKEEFFEFFLPQSERVARVAADDLWVLGQLDDTDYSEEDYNLITQRLRETYAQQYIDAWRSALNSIELRRFESIQDAALILERLSGADDPIRRLAQLTRDNTLIFEPEAALLEGDEAPTTELPLDEDRAMGLRINAAFSEIHRMLDEEPEGGAPNIVEIREALVSLHDYVNSVNTAQEPNVRALELAIARAELRGDDPIFVVQRIAERTPAPFDAHLRDAAAESWRVIMVAATEELNRRWSEEIYGSYQRLIAGRYPFDRTSPDDLPLDDFEEFFAPGGILDSFYNEELLTFVNESTGQPRIIDGQSLAVDRDSFEQLRAAIDISRSFFDANGDLAVEFQAATVGMSANLRRAVLNFEGQLVVSTHGPSRPARVVWPNIINGPQFSSVDMAPLAGTGRSLQRSYEGPWSFLRLYDAAAKSNAANNSVDISFSNANGQTATFRIRTESDVNVFFNSPLSSFNLPAQLRVVER